MWLCIAYGKCPPICSLFFFFGTCSSRLKKGSKKELRCRASNPGLSGESRVSWPARLQRIGEHWVRFYHHLYNGWIDIKENVKHTPFRFFFLNINWWINQNNKPWFQSTRIKSLNHHIYYLLGYFLQCANFLKKNMKYLFCLIEENRFFWNEFLKILCISVNNYIYILRKNKC